ncbi:AIG1 family protein (macronuclear) [Tetrahymena thermophila SB210]|uniref:AIG1 family protein n=1 Tax=Tetrahymena thermophila (strain SB210) TaxID=312017 RepID=Q24C58_TETTS|nr:AIG1 family protein [Tetrahymena thermophila SB210]EAS05380.1 AIG1 family protein [Tetrahymena thermophila SB210]|eukprot:XP_001025625.1 AIG1 family protein [Tetrahymena thermophila SB210]
MLEFSNFFKQSYKKIIPAFVITIYADYQRKKWFNDQSYVKTILVLGPTGVGKSTLCNCILDANNYFKSSSSFKSQTKQIQQHSKQIINEKNHSIKINVIDTPGLFDHERSNKEIINEITQIIKNNNVDHIILMLQYSLRAKPQDQMLFKSMNYCIPINNKNSSVIVNFVFPSQNFNFEKNESESQSEQSNKEEDYVNYIKNLFSQSSVYQISIEKSNQQIKEFQNIKNKLFNDVLENSSIDDQQVKTWSEKMSELEQRDYEAMITDYCKQLTDLQKERDKVLKRFDMKKKYLNGTALGTVAAGVGVLFKYTFRGAFLIGTPFALYASNYFDILKPEVQIIEEYTQKINQKEELIKQKQASKKIDENYISKEYQFFLDFSNSTVN